MQLRWYDLSEAEQALIQRVWMEAIAVSDPAYVDEGELDRCLRDQPLDPETITAAAAGDIAAVVAVCDAFAVPVHRVLTVSEVMPAVRLAQIAAAAGVPIEEAEAIVGADWSNMADHVRWLATAPDRDIINWLWHCYASARSWRQQEEPMRFIVVLNGGDDPTLMNQPVTVEEEYALPVNPADDAAHVLLCIVRPEPWAVQAVEQQLRVRHVPYLRDDDDEGVLSLPDGYGNHVRVRWVAGPDATDGAPHIQATIAGLTRDGYPWVTEECQALTLWRAIEDAMTIAYRLGR